MNACGGYLLLNDGTFLDEEGLARSILLVYDTCDLLVNGLVRLFRVVLLVALFGGVIEISKSWAHPIFGY